MSRKVLFALMALPSPPPLLMTWPLIQLIFFTASPTQLFSVFWSAKKKYFFVIKFMMQELHGDTRTYF